MYEKLAAWIDGLPFETMSDKAVAFYFCLYDYCNDLDWGMDLLTASRFDEDDPDWPCDVVEFLNTRENCFSWRSEAEWDAVLDEVLEALKAYLENGSRSAELKSKAAVSAGFDDGDIFNLYIKQ